MKRKPPLALIVLLLSLWVIAVVTAAEDDYQIGQGDVVHIIVYDEADLERTLTVQPDGYIRYPLVKRLKIGGLGVREAEKKLETLLGERFLVNPQVSLTIKEFHAKKVYVLGDVKTPGLYSLTGPTTVLEIISKAGGIVGPVGKILLVRGAGPRQSEISALLAEQGDQSEDALKAVGIQPPLVIDGHDLFDKGDMSLNHVLQDGDVVYVPQIKKVYVLGEVKRPGGVPFTEGLTLLQAISLAGGTTEMSSNRIYVTRKNEQNEEVRIKVKYSAMLKDRSKDIMLQPDDVILVKRRIL
ncbi:MAG: SLBB domain-containing protein [Candidatus Lernaella stagnicola]|nr:SLBB domain-containing protein [Candidatus Lernaella stagnicola]